MQDRRPAANLTSASLASRFVPNRRRTNTSSLDFVTVDLRGLKAALVAHAQAQRVSVSVLVLVRGAYLAGLIADVPVLSGGANRADHLATLSASRSELSTLSRNIHHLTTLQHQGDVDPARAYREMLDTLAGDIRSHLVLASGFSADLRPRVRPTGAAERPHL